MEIYIVTIEGIISCSIYGIYDDYELAKKKAKEAKNEQRDGYHSIVITGATLNECIDGQDKEIFFEGTH